MGSVCRHSGLWGALALVWGHLWDAGVDGWPRSCELFKKVKVPEVSEGRMKGWNGLHVCITGTDKGLNQLEGHFPSVISCISTWLIKFQLNEPEFLTCVPMVDHCNSLEQTKVALHLERAYLQTTDCSGVTYEKAVVLLCCYVVVFVRLFSQSLHPKSFCQIIPLMQFANIKQREEWEQSHLERRMPHTSVNICFWFEMVGSEICGNVSGSQCLKSLSRSLTIYTSAWGLTCRVHESRSTLSLLKHILAIAA